MTYIVNNSFNAKGNKNRQKRGLHAMAVLALPRCKNLLHSPSTKPLFKVLCPLTVNAGYKRLADIFVYHEAVFL